MSIVKKLPKFVTAMKHLYFFNPENDLALGADMPHFTPPAAALKLKRAACMLPMWYAADGDYVLVDTDLLDVCERMAGDFNINVKFVSDIPTDITGIVPWGWSRHARQQLLSCGCNPSLLPGDETLEEIRTLSHRRLTIKIYESLGETGLPYPLPPVPREVSDSSFIVSELEAGRHKFVKSPWSGSGRGVINTTTMPVRQVIRLADGIIKRQGSVMVEEKLDKVVDFAMLFDMERGKARFVGYSVFFNESYSTYSGNLLADDSRLEAKLMQYVDMEHLHATRQALVHALECEIGNRYSGPLGIDMMIYRDGDEYRLAPCVEVNLRMTMGRVAHELTRRYLSDGHEGIMKIVSAREQIANIGNEVRYLTLEFGNDFAFVMKSKMQEVVV